MARKKKDVDLIEEISNESISEETITPIEGDDYYHIVGNGEDYKVSKDGLAEWCSEHNTSYVTITSLIGCPYLQHEGWSVVD